ncbi:MAG TPA: cytochrome c biogenesis protein CcdA [Candidatus Binataceae bacterium]|nr:cytochrome c biogenesis protein CcdA [Candidatus Binataceae bacterium]
MMNRVIRIGCRAPSNRRLSAASLFVLAAILGFAIPAFALPKPNEIVEITSLKLDHPLVAGQTSNLEIDAIVMAGWHINSDRPLSEDYIPTAVAVVPPASITVGPVQYPKAEEVALEFSGGDKLSVFSGFLVVSVPLKAAADYKPAPGQDLAVSIDYQACNNLQCLRPASVSSTVALDSLPASAPSGGAAASVAQDSATGTGLGESEHVLDDIFAHHGWFLGFLAVLLGGLALNLTPCVYPLIGVTIAYFGNQGGGPRRVLVLAIVYVLGIALMFSAVGVAVALSGGLFGAALQNPIVLSALAAMMVTLALSSFGLFSLQPPQWMMRRAGIARPGYAGSLLMGFGMGVVAAPCIGPIVLGLLLMVERSESPLFGFALFFTLAVGLGLPYIALALAAGSIRQLPRSGEWLAWVEQLFGFILIGLALYFLEPVVPHHLLSRALPFYAAAAGIWLGFVARAGRAWQPFLVFRSIVGVAAVAALIYFVIQRPGAQPLTFEPFNPSLIATASETRKPVLIDFSADWCIPCREMEHSTFIDPSVVREASRFVRMRADLTHQDKTNEALMSQYQIQGVPTTLIIDSSGHVQVRKVGYIGSNEFLADLRRTD